MDETAVYAVMHHCGYEVGGSDPVVELDSGMVPFLPRVQSGHDPEGLILLDLSLGQITVEDLCEALDAYGLSSSLVAAGLVNTLG